MPPVVAVERVGILPRSGYDAPFIAEFDSVEQRLSTKSALCVIIFGLEVRADERPNVAGWSYNSEIIWWVDECDVIGYFRPGTVHFGGLGVPSCVSISVHGRLVLFLMFTLLTSLNLFRRLSVRHYVFGSRPLPLWTSTFGMCGVCTCV